MAGHADRAIRRDDSRGEDQLRGISERLRTELERQEQRNVDLRLLVADLRTELNAVEVFLGEAMNELQRRRFS